MLVFLSQQAAELLVTLTEVGLTRHEGLVALTQLLVQLSTNRIKSLEKHREGRRGNEEVRRWVKSTRYGMSNGGRRDKRTDWMTCVFIWRCFLISIVIEKTG